mmetsp:Transcript_94020/g.148658  ORF Transcript_94020/g.148658 Transcript_94020/m.148658 type:complete len:724 (+) Transcript_94020:71-2242(+)
MALVVPAPIVRMTDTNLRFSDVAQFVGLSLMRDPSAPRSKGKQRQKLGSSVGSRSIDADFAYSQSYGSLPSASRELSQKKNAHSESAPLLPQVNQNSERFDQLKIQLGYLKAEQQAEQQQLKQLEHMLSNSLIAERKAHERAEKERERRDFHRDRARRQEAAIHSLQEEMRACAQPVQKRSSPKSEHVVSTQTSMEAPPKPEQSQEQRAQVLSKALPQKSKHVLPARRTRADVQPAREKTKAEVAPIQESETIVRSNEVDDLAKVERGSSSSSTGQGAIKEAASTSQSEVQGIDLSSFESEEELDNYRREVIRSEMMKRAGNAITAFATINLNGSGRICSQEFADGVARLGVPWQLLTGLHRPRQLFRLFDRNPTDGVISLYELFPTERNKIRDDSGLSTPDFWKNWVKKNHNMAKGCGGPKWQPTSPEEELEMLFDARVKNEQSAFKHRWMSTTFRRMKARGKSDARCREMLALHLPKGSGPADLQDVKTFSQNEVIHCKRMYNDAVLEPQRKILKNLYSLREHRRQINTAKQKLYAVALEPFVRQKAQEKVVQDLAMGGLSLGLHKHHHIPEHVDSADEVDHIYEKPEDMAQGQASFSQLSKMTGMDVSLIEDVFKIWMQHADKTETINKKHFQRLLEDLCPQRAFAENDLEAWWDQVHERGDAARLTVDWQASDPDGCEGPDEDSEENNDISRSLRETRKSPASFDQFLIWWSSSEVRGA